MTDAEALEFYRHLQNTAHEVVLQILAYDKKNAAEREQMLALTAAALGNTTRAVLGIGFSARKGLVLDLHLALPTVEAALIYGLALLLAERTLRRRIGLCAHEGCEVFFFDTREHGGGHQRYCSYAHSDIDRVSRWRQKRKVGAKA